MLIQMQIHYNNNNINATTNHKINPYFIILSTYKQKTKIKNIHKLQKQIRTRLNGFTSIYRQQTQTKNNKGPQQDSITLYMVIQMHMPFESF